MAMKVRSLQFTNKFYLTETGHWTLGCHVENPAFKERRRGNKTPSWLGEANIMEEESVPWTFFIQVVFILGPLKLVAAKHVGVYVD